MAETNKALTIRQIKLEKPKERRVHKTPKLSISLIDNAITDYEVGKFKWITKVAKKMLLDEHFSAFLESRLLHTLSYKKTFQKDFEQEPLLYFLDKTTSYETIKEVLKQYLLFGISVCYINWEKKEGQWLPNLVHLALEHLEWEQDKACWVYNFATERRWFDNEDPNFFILSDFKLGYTSGLVTKLAKSWALSEIAKEDWKEANEYYNNPIYVVKLPAEAANDEVSRDNLALELQDKKRDRVLVLGNDQDFDVFTTHSTGYDAEPFLKLVKEARKSYAMSILGGNLTSDVEGGSYAAAQVHENILNTFIKADSLALSNSLQKIIDLILVFNNIIPNEIPKLNYFKEDNEDFGQLLDNLLKVKSITNREIDNLDDLLEKGNITLGTKENTSQN